MAPARRRLPGGCWLQVQALDNPETGAEAAEAPFAAFRPARLIPADAGTARPDIPSMAPEIEAEGDDPDPPPCSPGSMRPWKRDCARPGR